MSSSRSGRESGGHNELAEQKAGSPALPTESADRKSPTPNQCRNFAREAVADSLPEIVGTFVNLAKDGSVPHFNLLSKFAGFDQRPVPAPSKRRGKSFARRLLDNMKEHEAKMIAANEARMAAERAPGK